MHHTDACVQNNTTANHKGERYWNIFIVMDYKSRRVSTGRGQRLVPGNPEEAADVEVDEQQEGEREPLLNGTAPCVCYCAHLTSSCLHVSELWSCLFAPVKNRWPLLLTPSCESNCHSVSYFVLQVSHCTEHQTGWATNVCHMQERSGNM